jgi:RES domain-containing protein
MILWRLSGVAHAQAFDGGYGLLYDGRWNTAGHAVTYCATSPSLCVLEKLVHVEDPELLPALMMVRYDVPDVLGLETVSIAELSESWQFQEGWTQGRGDAWHEAVGAPLLKVPSAIVPLDGSPDENVLINHRHPSATQIQIAAVEAFALDIRLFAARPTS